MVFDGSKPLPDPKDVEVVSWQLLMQKMIDRVKLAILAIIEHPVVPRARWLHVSGPNGLMMVLRLVEFMRRVSIYHHIMEFAETIEQIRTDLSELLAKEAWRRWARGSLQVQTPKPKDDRTAPGDIYFLWEILTMLQIKSQDSAAKVS